MRKQRCVEGQCYSSTVWLRRNKGWERGQDGADEGVAPQRRDDIPGKLRRHPCLGLPGQRPQMRGRNYALVGQETPQDRIARDGSLPEDIERGPYHAVLVKRRE
jgi:hypothetical protein